MVLIYPDCVNMAENIPLDRTNVKCVMLHAFGNQDELKVCHCDTSDLKVNGHEVDVKVVVSGMNFADIYTRQGLPTGSSHSLTPPFVCGLECAGIVEEIGDNVSNFQVTLFVTLLCIHPM